MIRSGSVLSGFRSGIIRFGRPVFARYEELDRSVVRPKNFPFHETLCKRMRGREGKGVEEGVEEGDDDDDDDDDDG